MQVQVTWGTYPVQSIVAVPQVHPCNSIDQQQNANANNAGIFKSMDESCQVLWHSNFWLHCMTSAVANVLMSISTSHANDDANALQCNVTQYIATVCALGASDSNDQQHNTT